MRSRDRAAGASINPQWEGSNLVHGSKLYGPPSHLSLSNHVTAHHINPIDFRHLAGPTHQYQKQKEAAFTRGDAITGWNFATTVDQRNLKQQLSSSLANSIKSTHKQIVALKQYQTPAQHSAAVAEKVRAARSAAGLQLAALEAKYGKDGAAELQRIANMHPVGIKRKHQATKQDLQAVAELDDPQNLSDTGYIT
ncbi:MAG: hypothetical protein FRX49_10848 [Trebouxia sp. A1-2]|nr:MAG: hypothetical protein FRX49_10848 [Trebouxia sp. A1-2]